MHYIVAIYIYYIYIFVNKNVDVNLLMIFMEFWGGVSLLPVLTDHEHWAAS